MLLKAGQVGNTIIWMVLFRSYVAIDYNSTVCPDKSQWSLRADSLCNTNNPAYFCLLDENEKTFKEFCEKEPNAQTPGHKFVIRGGLDSTQCEKSRYQPFKLTTYGYSRCMFEKTKCIEEGQIHYDNGTTTYNRLCRCDYSSSYTFIKTTGKSCYCDPTLEDCSCYMIMCPDGYVLSPDYVCIELKSFTGKSNCPEIKRYQMHSEGQDKNTNIVKTKSVKQFSTTRPILEARIGYSVLCGLFVIVMIVGVIAIKRYWAEIQREEDSYKIQLAKNHAGIIKIRVEDIVKLMPDYSMTEKEKDRIRKMQSKRTQADAFFHFLITNDVKTFRSFVDTLRIDNAYGTLADAIEMTPVNLYESIEDFSIFVSGRISTDKDTTADSIDEPVSETIQDEQIKDTTADSIDEPVSETIQDEQIKDTTADSIDEPVSETIQDEQIKEDILRK